MGAAARRGRAGAGRHARRRRPAATVLTVAGVLVVSVGATGAMWVARHSQQHPGPQAVRSGTGLASRLRAKLPARAQYARAGRAARLAALDQQLGAELGALLGRHAGSLAVGVADRSTGTVVMYHSGERFRTASIVKADILATLLLRAQRPGQPAPLPAAVGGLAEMMMERSSNGAATHLWQLAGGAAGITRANARLGLRHTVPDPGGAWGLTSTTVADQLRLLAGLTMPGSPLTPAARGYELALMRTVAPAGNGGVSAAASPGSGPAVTDGSLSFPALWIVNSIGVIRHNGQLLCVAVLSDEQPSYAAGIRQVRAAAVAAVRLVTAHSGGGRADQPPAGPGNRTGRPGPPSTASGK